MFVTHARVKMEEPNFLTTGQRVINGTEVITGEQLTTSGALVTSMFPFLFPTKIGDEKNHRYIIRWILKRLN